MIIFNGQQFAAQKETALSEKIAAFQQKFSRLPRVASLVFFEDQGGLVYSQEKKQVAKRLGVEYEIVQTSLSQRVESIQKIILKFAENPQITGIIIQKPWKKNWDAFHEHEPHPAEAFTHWWHALTKLIPQSKDIDGLNPETLQSIKVGNWAEKGLVLPATCRAVLSILETAQQVLNADLAKEKALIIGRSELLGTPLSYELKHLGWPELQLVGKSGFQQLAETPSKLGSFQTIITSTGIHNLISGEMIKPGSVIIDAGFPQGDVNFDAVAPKTRFITPVPNGVGPVTVISLLENAVELCYNLPLNK